MSFSPSLGVVRLQELRLWQGNYDNILQKPKSSKRTGESVTPPSISENLSSENANDWDRRHISPTKPFEQLLEEKLAEDIPVAASPKPKRPFLKKGQGIARFRMGATPQVTNTRNSSGSKRKDRRKQHSPQGISRPKSASAQNQNTLSRSKPSREEIDLSPLTVPDFVKPRGTWKQVFEHSSQSPTDCEKEPTLFENYEEFRKSLGSTESQDNLPSKASNEASRIEKAFEQENSDLHGLDLSSLNKDILMKVNSYARNYFQKQTPLLFNNIPDNIRELQTPKAATSEQLKDERELKIFEVLEEKVDHSSFCSTNTSVVNLLASTPRKCLNRPRKDKVIEEEHDAGDPVFSKQMDQTIQAKLHEVNKKTDLLQQLLLNLQHMELQANMSLESDSTRKTTDKTTSYTSFSDENSRWSTRSPSLVDEYTECDTCRNSSWKKIDAGVNTSFDNADETIKASGPCQECHELRAKHSDAKLKVAELKSENSRLKAELQDLQKSHDRLKKTSKKEEERLRQDVEKLQEELDSERKKIAKDKAYFENYVKEAQNRPSKKEREEITQLKQELADLKELIKMKETKSGATNARLRTQIKQQEKELAETKTTLEKLQKENAKLTASQKYISRPREVKMLQEINKNLSKLTEQQFKKQANKSGSGDVKDPIIDKSDKENSRSDDSEEPSKTATSEGSLQFSLDDPKLIEQRYTSMFGKFESPRDVSTSTSVEKTEKTLPDGSVEVKYSNGNLKTVSADGKRVTMKYFNGDTKETDLNEQIVKYYYASADAWHIQYRDGKEVMDFKDGQKCTKHTDGRTEISYPDGSFRIINADGTEELRFPDGRKALKNLEGEQIILLPNGQREVHTNDYKRREYPDGTIRTLHKDGTVETVYANGRVRLKDANGVLIMDTHQT